MSDCGVCIGGYDADGPLDFFDVRFPVARKPFRCCECKRTVEREQYEYRVSKYDGEFSATKTCMECREIAIGFTCDGVRLIGELWADMQKCVFPVMTSACFDRLQSPKAKAFLRQQWMKWKGLDN